MTSANVTRRALSLGDADATTGWYAKTFNETTIKMSIQPRGSNMLGTGAGFYAKYDITGFTASGVLEGDEIIDSNSTYYSVEAVEEEWWLDSFSHYICSLTRLPLHADRPTTYGTGASVDDPRYRMKVYLDTYLTAANLLEDNGVTEASFIVCFANPDYPIGKILITKSVDLVFTCGEPNSVPLPGFNHKPYGYEESVPITVYTVNKSGITAENLKQQAEAELRRIAETYPAPTATTLHLIASTRSATQRYGGQSIYGQTYVWTYRRDMT